LCQTFATVIADPFLFDSVLDLYDTFGTLHSILTEVLPERRRSELGISRADKRSGWLPPLDGQRVEHLSSLVDALHNALSHRVAKAYPENQIRDMATDFRGGLNQILLAADAPLMCGLGLVRKYVMSYGQSPVPRTALGGLTRISFLPGIRAWPLGLPATTDMRLVFVDADVPNVLHAPSYADYLHECAHFILPALRQKGLADAAPADDLQRDRVEEIFAMLITHVFIFGNDSRSFLFHHIVNYGKARRDTRRESEDIMVRYAELAVRLFFVVDSIPIGQGRGRWAACSWQRKVRKFRAVLERFECMMDELGPLLPNYRALWAGRESEGREYSRIHFHRCFESIATNLPDLWTIAMVVFEQYYAESLATANDPEADAQPLLQPVVEKAMREGRPLLRAMFDVRSQGSSGSIDPDEAGIDALLFRSLFI
jgi:hypothetical protein